MGNSCKKLRDLLPCISDDSFGNKEFIISLAERFLLYFETDNSVLNEDIRPRHGRRDKRSINYVTENDFDGLDDIDVAMTTERRAPDSKTPPHLDERLDKETLMKKAQEILSKPPEMFKIDDVFAAMSMSRFISRENLIRNQNRRHVILTDISGDEIYVVGNGPRR